MVKGITYEARYLMMDSNPKPGASTSLRALLTKTRYVGPFFFPPAPPVAFFLAPAAVLGGGGTNTVASESFCTLYSIFFLVLRPLREVAAVVLAFLGALAMELGWGGGVVGGGATVWFRGKKWYFLKK